MGAGASAQAKTYLESVKEQDREMVEQRYQSLLGEEHKKRFLNE